MKSEYQKSLINWVKGLSDSELAECFDDLDRFNDAELSALILEDIRRISMFIQ